MKPSHLVAIVLIALSLSGCRSSTGMSRNTTRLLNEDEKHRLYSAALAASETPLDTDTFKDVCQKIEIFDAAGKPNQKYLIFVSDHVNWSLVPENQGFRRQIDTREKAREYINQQLPR